MDITKVKLLKDDNSLLKFLKSQIVRYSKLFLIAKEFRSLPKKTKTHRCSSTILRTLPLEHFNTEEPEKLRYHLPLCVYGKNVDLCETVEIIFEKLIEQYEGTSWCKQDKKPILHIAAIKQFWFDCCLSDLSLLGLLIEALPQKVWINIEGFYKSVQAAQKVSAYNFFSLKRYDKKTQKNFLVQKLMCKSHLVFFCFVQFEAGDCLNKESMFKVLIMANKKEKTKVLAWVDLYFARASELRGYNKEAICFEEFYVLIKTFELY